MSYKVTIPKYGTERIRPLYPAPLPCAGTKDFGIISSHIVARRIRPFGTSRSLSARSSSAQRPAAGLHTGRTGTTPFPSDRRRPAWRLYGHRNLRNPVRNGRPVVSTYVFSGIYRIKTKKPSRVSKKHRDGYRHYILRSAWGIYIPLYTTCLSARSAPHGRQPSGAESQ